jgi:sulfur-oxidizing protein SoxX
MSTSGRVLATATAVAILLVVVAAQAQGPPSRGPIKRDRPPGITTVEQRPDAPAPDRHPHHPAAPAARTAGHDHGAPAGWKFTLPPGNASKGRDVFVKLECYACHAVKGQTFPGGTNRENLGPELSAMAGHHDVEFFAESIVNPNAVVDVAEWRAPDGTSRMPSFNDSLTVQELIDLVAFLKSLTPPAGATPHHKH